MEIILKEDIIGLGYKNEIVKVKNGYGRNYLIPTGKGVIASPSARKQLAENLKQQAAKLAALKAEAEKKAAQLDGVELVIAATVVEELAKRGIEIDRKIVTMHDMKKVGSSEATVHFHREVEVKIPVTVVAENQPAPAVEEVPAEQPAEAPAAVEETPAAEEEAPAAE